MFNFAKLVSTDYLFTINTIMLTRSDKLFFIIGAIFTVFSVVLKVAALYAPNPVDKVIRSRLFRLFLTIGLIEVIWFGARYQNVRFFGSHFVALLTLLIGLVWFIQIAVSAFRHYKVDKIAWEKEQVKLKYLPK